MNSYIYSLPRSECAISYSQESRGEKCWRRIPRLGQGKASYLTPWKGTASVEGAGVEAGAEVGVGAGVAGGATRAPRA